MLFLLPPRGRCLVHFSIPIRSNATGNRYDASSAAAFKEIEEPVMGGGIGMPPRGKYRSR